MSTERACPPRGLTERCEPSEATEGLWALGMTFGFKIGVSRIFKLHYFLDCNSEAARVKKKKSFGSREFMAYQYQEPSLARS